MLPSSFEPQKIHTDELAILAQQIVQYKTLSKTLGEQIIEIRTQAFEQQADLINAAWRRKFSRASDRARYEDQDKYDADLPESKT